MSGGIYTATEHGFISSKHQRIAEIMYDYDPSLELVWIPHGDRLPEDLDKEFAVLHQLPGKPKYVVFYCKEDEVDERLLARLWSADNGTGNVLGKLDAMNAAVEAVKMKEEIDLAEERADLAKSIWKSPLHTFKHNGVKHT